MKNSKFILKFVSFLFATLFCFLGSALAHNHEENQTKTEPKAQSCSTQSCSSEGDDCSCCASCPCSPLANLQLFDYKKMTAKVQWAAKNINFSQEQQTQAIALLDERREKLESMQTSLKENKQKTKELTLAADFDEQLLRENIQKGAELYADHQVAMVKLNQALKGLMSEEQIAQMKEAKQAKHSSKDDAKKAASTCCGNCTENASQKIASCCGTCEGTCSETKANCCGTCGGTCSTNKDAKEVDTTKEAACCGTCSTEAPKEEKAEETTE